MLRRLLTLSLVVLGSVVPLAAQESDVAFGDIPWHNGPTRGDLGSEALVDVPEGCMFTGRDGVELFMKLTENPSGPAERGVVLCGMKAAAAEDTAGVRPWFVVYSFDESGYVRDDEGDKLDADAILASIRSGTDASNTERRRHGWETLKIEGWLTAPFYDKATHNLTWATAALASGGSRSANHSVRLLGRGGVMRIDLVTSPEQLPLVMPVFAGIVTGTTFKPGHRYSEWREGDKVASYGLTALVAGGVGAAAVKSGLLGKLWKVIIAGLVAAGTAVKSLFSRKQSRTASA